MKVKNMTEQDKEKQFEIDLSYEEGLRFNNSKPKSKELDEMERVFYRVCKHLVKYYPKNNFNYQPLQGA